MVGRTAVLLCLAACGRFGFDDGSSARSNDAGSDGDGQPPLVWPQLEERAVVELTSQNPFVAWNGEAFVVLARSGAGYDFATYSTDGELLDGPRAIDIEFPLHTFLRGDDLVLLHGRYTSDETVMSTFARDGTLTDSLVLQPSYSASFHELANGDLCMLWTLPGSNVLRAARLDGHGAQLTAPALIHDSDAEGDVYETWCNGDEVRLLGQRSGAPTEIFYKAVGIDGGIRVPQTTIAAQRPGWINISEAWLGTSAVVAYYLGGTGGDNVRRVSALALDGTTTVLDDTELAFPTEGSAVRWVDDRFVATWLASEAPEPYGLSYATISPSGAQLDAAVPIGRSLATAGTLPVVRSYTRSPEGHTVFGVAISDFVTDIGAYLVFLAPE